jgi:hypothetical protein
MPPNEEETARHDDDQNDVKNAAMGLLVQLPSEPDRKKTILKYALSLLAVVFGN